MAGRSDVRLTRISHMDKGTASDNVGFKKLNKVEQTRNEMANHSHFQERVAPELLRAFATSIAAQATPKQKPGKESKCPLTTLLISVNYFRLLIPGKQNRGVGISILP